MSVLGDKVAYPGEPWWTLRQVGLLGVETHTQTGCQDTVSGDNIEVCETVDALVTRVPLQSLFPVHLNLIPDWLPVLRPAAQPTSSST